MTDVESQPIHEETFEALMAAVRKQHPQLLEAGGRLAEHVTYVCEDVARSIPVLEKDVELSLRLGPGHFRSIANQIGRAYAGLDNAMPPEVLEPRLDAVERTLDIEFFKLMSREFDLTDRWRQVYAQHFELPPEEFARAGAVQRLFKEGEAVRWGRLGVAGAVAAGVTACVLTGRKSDAPASWQARIEAANEAKDPPADRSL